MLCVVCKQSDVRICDFDFLSVGCKQTAFDERQRKRALFYDEFNLACVNGVVGVRRGCKHLVFACKFAFDIRRGKRDKVKRYDHRVRREAHKFGAILAVGYGVGFCIEHDFLCADGKSAVYACKVVIFVRCGCRHGVCAFVVADFIVACKRNDDIARILFKHAVKRECALAEREVVAENRRLILSGYGRMLLCDFHREFSLVGRCALFGQSERHDVFACVDKGRSARLLYAVHDIRDARAFLDFNVHLVRVAVVNLIREVAHGVSYRDFFDFDGKTVGYDIAIFDVFAVFVDDRQGSCKLEIFTERTVCNVDCDVAARCLDATAEHVAFKRVFYVPCHVETCLCTVVERKVVIFVLDNYGALRHRESAGR